MHLHCMLLPFIFIFMYLGFTFFCLHGTHNVKLVNAQQAKQIHKYKKKNTKEKLYKCKTAIWYNKTCR